MSCVQHLECVNRNEQASGGLQSHRHPALLVFAVFLVGNGNGPPIEEDCGRAFETHAMLPEVERWSAFRSIVISHFGIVITDFGSGSRVEGCSGAIRTIGGVDRSECSLRPQRPATVVISEDGCRVAFSAVGDLDPTVENEDQSLEVFMADCATGTISQVTDTHPALDCNPTVAPCGPVVRAMDSVGDALLVANTGATLNGLPLPLSPVALRVVSRHENRQPILQVPPVITAPADVVTDTILRATDPDGLPITFFVQGVGFTLGTFADSVVNDHGDGTAELTLSPLSKELGQYVVRVAVFNEAGGVAEQDVQVVVSAPAPSATGTVPVTPTATTSATLVPTATPSPMFTASATVLATRTASNTAPPTSTRTILATMRLRDDGGCTITPLATSRRTALFLLWPVVVRLRRRRGTRTPARSANA